MNLVERYVKKQRSKKNPIALYQEFMDGNGWSNVHTLQRKADAISTIFVNGIALYNGTDYRFDSKYNHVVFIRIPRDGETVEIRYWIKEEI